MSATRMPSDSHDWTELTGRQIVLDMSSPYVVLGQLDEVGPTFLRLSDADIHDLRDSRTTRELYVLEARHHGIRGNRRQVWVRIAEIVSLSLLADVLE